MRGRFFYGWLIVAVTAVVLLATAGVRSAPGAFLLSMDDEPGWTTGALSFAAAVGLLVYGLSGPVSGRLMGRIGIKGVTILSLLVTAGALLGSAFVREIWLLTIFLGFLSGLGTGLVASVLGPTVANRWFVKDRGLVVGIFGASVSAGQLVFFPVLTAIAVTIGWRSGAIVLAVIALVLLVPVAIWSRDDPADIRERPRGAEAGSPVTRTPPPDPGVMRRAVRSPDFWFLASTFFVCGATSNGLIGQRLCGRLRRGGMDRDRRGLRSPRDLPPGIRLTGRRDRLRREEPRPGPRAGCDRRTGTSVSSAHQAGRARP